MNLQNKTAARATTIYWKVSLPKLRAATQLRCSAIYWMMWQSRMMWATKLVGHLAQKACQATLVDVLGQAVAETQQGHHPAPADATLKQARSYLEQLIGILHCGLRLFQMLWKSKS